MNTAQQMVDNNITMFGYPGDYHQGVFNASEDHALMKLAETYYIPETWVNWENDFEYYIQEKGTHANVYSYPTPDDLQLGKWWRSTENIPGLQPYGGFMVRKKWHLGEVLFAIISFRFI